MSDGPTREQLEAYARAREVIGDNAYVYVVDGIEGHTWRRWYQVGTRYKGQDTLLGCGRTWQQAFDEAVKTAIRPPSAGQSLRNGKKR